jgi:hypothetical protein
MKQSSAPLERGAAQLICERRPSSVLSQAFTSTSRQTIAYSGLAMSGFFGELPGRAAQAQRWMCC